MAATREGALFVSAATGEITDSNSTAVTLLGLTRGEVLNRHLPDLVRLPDGANLLETLTRLAGARTANDIPVRTSAGRELSMRSTLFRATGEQMLLCQIVDAQSVSVRSDSIDDHLNGLFEKGADGIVFISKAGAILSANDAFMRLTDVVHAQGLKGRSIADFLSRGSVDLNVICENATRTGSMRLYATRLVGENGGEIPVEIATTLLNGGQDTVFAMVIRDASRAEMVRKSSHQITDVDMRSVIELIGSQTLKSIVAKTTDAIEKMCIETAVELTSNNRVAAAEMLGLSRQSLYVKLRKYDLLKKELDE
jgi:transcriptional regulator PpsR